MRLRCGLRQATFWNMSGAVTMNPTSNSAILRWTIPTPGKTGSQRDTTGGAASGTTVLFRRAGFTATGTDAEAGAKSQSA